MLDISYGYHARSEADERIDLADRVVQDISECIQPGAWTVDAFPIRKLPDSCLHPLAYRLLFKKSGLYLNGCQVLSSRG